MNTFKLPDFLLNQSADDIHKRMLANLPDDIDKSEGQFAWDYTRPTALEKAQFIEFQMAQALQLIVPQFSYGSWLDLHAYGRGLARKQATYAEGIITVTGSQGVTIPLGSVFSTESINGEPSIDFVTTENATISQEGTVDIHIQCATVGAIGNVAKNTIVLKSNNVSNLLSITNPNDLTGGTEEEDDDSFRERILEYDRTQGASFVGSCADYKRWAMSVDGVGKAEVIPANNSSGLVTIIITDSEHNPGSPTLCENVYNYIMRPDNESERLAPVNAYLSVVAPETLDFTVSATVEINTTTTIGEVTTAFYESLKSYFLTALDDLEVRYTRVSSLLSNVAGVIDYQNLLINGGTANIPLTNMQTPAISLEDISLTQSAT